MRLYRLLPLVLLPFSLALQSCAPDEYAAELATVLNTYAEQVSRRLAEEEKRYRREAHILQEAEDRALNMSVDEEIAKAAVGLAADIKDGRTAGDRAVSNATAFGQAEFDRARQFAARDQDAELQRIRTLQSLQTDSAKIEALRAALEVLAKKPNWKSAIAESVQFGRDTKDRLDLLTCEDLDETVKQLTTQSTELSEEIEAAANDAGKKAELMKRQDAMQASLKVATDGRAATGHYDSTTQSCK